MRFKVGDRVRIKSIDWYNENKNKEGNIPLIWNTNSKYNFIKIMQGLCGKVMTISRIHTDSYNMVEDNCKYFWTDEMIEGLVEEEVDLIPKFGEYSDNEPLDIPTMTTDFIKEHGLSCPNGYIFKDENGNIINATKIVLEKKKKEYPKTFCECQDYLEEDVPPMVEPISKTHRRRLVHLLEVLLTCRDAYWKIAGEEIGLGKPWEPDLLNDNQPKFTLANWDDNIEKRDYSTNRNYILTFPTAEMRDAFYENFKELIEQCKELL